MAKAQLPKDRKHILMFVGTHVYDDARVLPEAKSLVKASYTVTAIGMARYGGLKVRDRIDGVDVIIAPMVTSYHPIKLLREVWRWLRGDPGKITDTITKTYKTSNLLSLIFFALWMLRLGIGIPAQVIHCHDFMQLPAGWLLARWHRARLIYDARESAPHTYAAYSPSFGRFVERVERWLLPKCDAVIAVGEVVGHDLEKRGASRFTVIGNWKPLDEFAPDTKRMKQEHERLALDQYRLVIAYLGSLSSGRNIEELLEAVAQSPEVGLLVSGQGLLEARVVDAAKRASNIHWLGWLPKADVALYTQLCDVVYICIRPDYYQAGYVVPNKLFEAFAAGKPVIAYRGVGEMSQILQHFPAAYLMDDVTSDMLKTAFAALQDAETRKPMEQQARMASQEYNWSVAEGRLLALYQDLIS